MIVSSEPIRNHTDDHSFWVGISDSHDTIQDMLGELVDDSISSIISNPVKQKNVVITISEKVPEGWNTDYCISVEDSGAGIKNLDACFSFANTEGGESPLNRYGVALKKVLATFDPKNKYWKIDTRGEEEYAKNIFRRVEAPYSSENMVSNKIQGERWKGSFEGSGTLVTFPCSQALLATSLKEYPGHSERVEDYAACIQEEISAKYMPLIERGINGSIVVEKKDGTKDFYDFKVISPKWASEIKEDTVIKDFGRGKCRVHYRIGQIVDHPETMRYFRKNFRMSGVMVYENGRLIECNLFKEIWPNRVHPKFNSFLFIVEIDPIDGADALPPPTPTKDSLFFGDERVKNLYKWIREICPSPADYLKTNPPRPKDKERAEREKKKVDALVKYLRRKYGDIAVIKRELPLYNCIEKTPPRLDVYLYVDEFVNLFECKADDSSAQDVFQLLMYHMGALHDGIEPNVLTLVAERHPKGVRELVNYLNTCKAPDEQLYKFELMTWKDYGISSSESESCSAKKRSSSSVSLEIS